MSQTSLHSPSLTSATSQAIQPELTTPRSWLQKIILATLRVYQLLISPLLGPRCRFYPSCSDYATQAIQRDGVFGGLKLSLCRLSKCHPWHEGGFDPLPARDKQTQSEGNHCCPTDSTTRKDGHEC